jgi:DNA polymerase-3 subunit epsilon
MSLAQQVRRIDWIETAGEIGALLKEAALVKQLQPTHNRQLRKQRRNCAPGRWSMKAKAGCARELVYASDLEFGIAPRCYGLFKKRQGSQRDAARPGRIAQPVRCLLGLEKVPPANPASATRPQTLQRRLRRQGALAKHTMRLMTALTGLKLVSWPFPGPALIREGDEAHLIDGWRYLGTAGMLTSCWQSMWGRCCRSAAGDRLTSSAEQRHGYMPTFKNQMSLTPMPC